MCSTLILHNINYKNSLLTSTLYNLHVLPTFLIFLLLPLSPSIPTSTALSICVLINTWTPHLSSSLDGKCQPFFCCTAQHKQVFNNCIYRLSLINRFVPFPCHNPNATAGDFTISATFSFYFDHVFHFHFAFPLLPVLHLPLGQQLGLF